MSAEETIGDGDEKSVLDLTPDEARTFFLKHESYTDIALPPYIDFSKMLERVGKILKGKDLDSFKLADPRSFEGVNHVILNNKDGRYAWRPMALINPAIYISLVDRITESGAWTLLKKRFEDYRGNPQIRCLSIPVVSTTEKSDKAEQIIQWWHGIEQASIDLSLDYTSVVHTDIQDCYGSIYTHSIAWAVHTKSTAKELKNRNDPSLLGNQIDWHIQDMRHGQTNGIPQSSVLMDFVAEMVLGYADMELTKKIQLAKITD